MLSADDKTAEVLVHVARSDVRARLAAYKTARTAARELASALAEIDMASDSTVIATVRDGRPLVIVTLTPAAVRNITTILHHFTYDAA